MSTRDAVLSILFGFALAAMCVSAGRCERSAWPSESAPGGLIHQHGGVR